MKVLISQSNYIPWRGYFDNISKCDVFVVFDDMQYTKRDWRNRNYIKTAHGLKWLTIPTEVKGKYLQKINETIVSDNQWNINHWQQIKYNYSKAAHFKQLSPWLEELYMTANDKFLTSINLHFLKSICKKLNINIEFKDSREFVLLENKTERLISICKELGATDYFSGPSGKNYMDENMFAEENIRLHYFDYIAYPEYPQLWPPYEPRVSIIDLLLNMGEEAKDYINQSI